jgi:hypothetical protein
MRTIFYAFIVRGLDNRRVSAGVEASQMLDLATKIDANEQANGYYK